MEKKYRKQEERHKPSEILKEIMDYGWDVTISIYMLLILVVLPFYNEEGYAHIGTDKATFFMGTIRRFSWVVLPLLAATLIWKGYLCLQKYRGSAPGERRLKCSMYCRREISVTDIFVAAYGICVMLSYCFSRYKSEALWGTSGWYMGMFPQLALVLSYFLISRCWKGHKWILITMFPVSAAVFLLGYLNRIDIYPIEMAYANPSFVSTIGNINWYCGYMMCVLFGGVCLLWNMIGETRLTQQAANFPVNGKKFAVKALLILYIILGFSSLLTQGSASGFLAWMAVMAVAYFLSIRDGQRMQNWWLLMVLFGGAGSCTYLLTKSGLISLNYSEKGIQALTGNEAILILTLVSMIVWATVKYRIHKGTYQPGPCKVVGKLVLAIILSLLGICLVIAIINTVTEGRILKMTPLSDVDFFLLDIRWGSYRGATLAAGVKCFLEQDFLHKLFGVGPDCMSAYLYADSSENLLAMVQEAFSSRRLTNAHNEWLTLLVNTGLLGMVCFVGMMVTAILRYLGVSIISSAQLKEDLNFGCHPGIGNVISLACGFCLLAYTVNNMVSFQQPMNLATVSVVLGIGEHYFRKKASLN